MLMTRTIRRVALFHLLLPVLVTGASIEVNLAAPATIQSRLQRGVVRPKARQAAIRALFQEAGCAAEEQPVRGKSANVICTLPGESDSTIVIGGHFDFAELGQGIVDDWSGAALLPSIYEALKGRPRRHTIVFAAFAEEEKGLVGSSRYVALLNNGQRSRVHAFVNLECLGLSSPKVWVHRATPALVMRLRETANSIHIPVDEMNVEKVGDDDSHPFVSANIPVISLHSLTPETWRILHSIRDRLDAVRLDDYYAAYKLAAIYVAYLDLKTE